MRTTLRTLTAVACLAVALAALLMAARPRAQSVNSPGPAPDPNIPVYFEAASIKASDSSTPGSSIRRQPGGRFSTVNVPARMLITAAYQIQGYQLVGGPSWLPNDRFDIVAKMEGDPPPVLPGTGADHMMLALRSLLADRFKLKVHRETREMDIYALTMARPGGKPGPALKPASDACKQFLAGAARGAPSPGASPAPLCGLQQTAGKIRVGDFPLSAFASSISAQLGRFVVDRAGPRPATEFEAHVRQIQAFTAGADAPPVVPTAQAKLHGGAEHQRTSSRDRVG
jgi:uncharacterized protein (TIGR03435 family)